MSLVTTETIRDCLTADFRLNLRNDIHNRYKRESKYHSQGLKHER